MTHPDNKNKLDSLRAPLVTNRIRSIAGQSFSFIPHRFFRDGFLASLDRDELALYIFLVLAANRFGVSFYGYDTICSSLSLSLDNYIAARNRLIDKDLIAFDGSRFQVLSLPPGKVSPISRPLKTHADFENHDPATILSIITSSLNLHNEP